MFIFALHIQNRSPSTTTSQGSDMHCASTKSLPSKLGILFDFSKIKKSEVRILWATWSAWQALRVPGTRQWAPGRPPWTWHSSEGPGGE